MNKTRQEIDQYLALWDQAQKQFPEEKKPSAPKKKDNSYFGMQNDVSESDFSQDEEEHWRDIYYRSLEIDPDEINGSSEQLLSEEEINAQYLAGMMDSREVREAKRKLVESRSAPKKRRLTEAKEPKKKVKEKDSRKPKEDETPKLDKKKDGFGKDLAKKPGKNVKFNVNPIHFASVSKDQTLRVTPNFTDGDELRQLAKLKALLYDLESELLGTDIRGGKTSPIHARLVAVRRQCEALSQALIPNVRTDVS